MRQCQLINAFKLGNGDVDIARDGPPRKPGARVVLFPYDFRLGVAVAAGQLQREVDQRLAEFSADERRKRVIVVAHSMGGLVARFWLGPLGRSALLRCAGDPRHPALGSAEGTGLAAQRGA
ncbi:MAG TPA: hypothetical protein VE709_08725, partial [Pseudonocardiaceae bacterium]|nr:hypothetical protein [Pseudonocardiaceae bacterium]